MVIRIKKKEIQDRSDIALSRPIICYFLFTAICVFGRISILSPLGISESIYNIVRYGSVLICLLFALPYIKKEYRILLVALEIVFGILYLITYLRGYMPQSEAVVYIVSTLLICVPCLACVASIENYEILYRGLLYSSLIISAIVIYYMFSIASLTGYTMSASYQLQFTGIIHTNEFFRAKKNQWLYLLLAVLELILIFVKGARGPVLCFAVFIAIKAISEVRNNRTALTFTILGVIALLVAAFNINTIISWTGQQLRIAGFYSRNFDALMTGALLSDSGRGSIQEHAISLIMKNPILGYGVASDVTLLNGNYVHSLFLELIFDFGIIIGFIIFVYITIIVIESFMDLNIIRKDLRMIFLINGYVMLFMSGTYLQSVYLFLLLGLAISSKRHLTFKTRR